MLSKEYRSLNRKVTKITSHVLKQHHENILGNAQFGYIANGMNLVDGITVGAGQDLRDRYI